ncbi:MAG: TetR/AcrR family transcriptional regulator [Eubacterium sp.]
MQNHTKYDKILDALQELLVSKDIQTISVSEIAQAAGIGKGSIYYYFPSKDAILEALIERNYEKPLETAKNLAAQTDVSPFTRMAMIFQACRNSSAELRKPGDVDGLRGVRDTAFLHQKYLNHLISAMKPDLTEIIQQGIDNGDIHFKYPAALAEIVLIVLAVKFDNTLVPSTPEAIEETMVGLIELLEKGTENPMGSLNFLKKV